jgi:hypothetical protein
MPCVLKIGQVAQNKPNIDKHVPQNKLPCGTQALEPAFLLRNLKFWTCGFDQGSFVAFFETLQVQKHDTFDYAQAK